MLMKIARVSFFIVLGFAIISSEVMATIAIYVVGGLLLCLIIALALDVLTKEK